MSGDPNSIRLEMFHGLPNMNPVGIPAGVRGPPVKGGGPVARTAKRRGEFPAGLRWRTTLDFAHENERFT